MKRRCLVLLFFCALFLVEKGNASTYSWSTETAIPHFSSYTPVTDPVSAFTIIGGSDGFGAVAWIGQDGMSNYVCMNLFTTTLSDEGVDLAWTLNNMTYELSAMSSTIQPTIDMYVDDSSNYYFIVSWLDESVNAIHYVTSINGGSGNTLGTINPSPALSTNPTSQVCMDGSGYAYIAYSATGEVVQLIQTMTAASGGTWPVTFTDPTTISATVTTISSVKATAPKGSGTSGAGVAWYQDASGTKSIYQYSGAGGPAHGTQLNAGAGETVDPVLNIFSNQYLSETYVTAWTQTVSGPTTETGVVFTNYSIGGAMSVFSGIWTISGAGDSTLTYPPGLLMDYSGSVFDVLVAVPTTTGFALYKNQVLDFFMTPGPSWLSDTGTTTVLTNTDSAKAGYISGNYSNEAYIVSWFTSAHDCSAAASNGTLGSTLPVSTDTVGQSLSAFLLLDMLGINGVAAFMPLRTASAMNYVYYPIVGASPPPPPPPPGPSSETRSFTRPNNRR